MLPLFFALFIATLPTYLIRFTLPVVGIPMTLLEVLFFALFATWLITDARKPGAWSAHTRFAVPLALFATGATIAVLVSTDARAALGLWRAYILEPLLFFPMAVDIFARYKKGRWVVAAFSFTAAWLGALAIYQKLTGWGIANPVWRDEATRRITTVFGFPNAVALLLVPMLVIIAAQAFEFLRASDKKEKWFALPTAIAFILGTLAIIFAVSEGGAIALACGLLAYGLFDRTLRPYALASVILTCAAVVTVPQLRDYATSLATLSDDSGSVRTIIWNETAQMLADRPIFGGGLSGYPSAITPYHNADWIEIFQYPHTILFNFLSEVGIIGLTGFIAIIITFFVIATKAHYGPRNTGWILPAAMSAMIALLVHGLVDVPYFKNDLAYLFWLIVAFAAATEKGTDPKVDKSPAEPAIKPMIGHRWS